MRKIFQSVVTLAARPTVSALSKRFLLSQRPQQKMMLSSSLVFLGQFAFTTASLNDFYEVEVPANLVDGESKEIQVGPKQDDCVLLCKVDGQYYCVSNKCSHYGAPLSSGLLVADKVKCPWHNAAFSVKTGAMEEGPMMDGIQTFPVEVKGDKVTIKVKKDLLNKNKTLNMASKGTDKTHYVIVGGGPAGLSAAESLRQGGFQGSITILTKEDLLPYDRTGLSKAIFNVGPKGSEFRDQAFFDKYGIDVKTGSTVESIHYDNQEINLHGGQKMKYDKLLLATGGRAIKPNVPGVDLQNVFTLRTVADVHKIKEAASHARNIVIVGSSFIGLESASSLKNELKDKANITVVGKLHVSFQLQLGDQVGKALQDFHETKGIKFLNKRYITTLKGEGAVSSVVLSDGTTIDADLVIYGIGVEPNVGFLGDINLNLKNGGVECDAFLKTNQKNVYAAGDIASYPYWISGEQVRVEHHNEAIYQGFVAAMNMIGNPTPVSQIPYFWTRHYDKTVQYSGIGSKYDDIIIDGDLSDMKFVAYYILKGRVVASASSGVPQAQQIISEALRLNIMPSAEDLKSKKVGLEQIKLSLNAKAGSCACRRQEINKVPLL